MGGGHSHPSIGTAQTSLALSGSDLTVVPFKIPRKNRLATIDLSDNNIKSLPGALTKLVDLNLARNNIRVFSNKMAEALSRCQRLESLDLSGNSLSELPAILTRLSKIKKLILSNNKLERVPLFSENANLEINLSQNVLCEVPDFSNETSVVILDYNLIEVFERQIDGLMQLFVNMNRLTRFEPTLRFNNLEVMEISKNRLERIPDLTEMAPRLRIFDASLNFLTEFPTFPETITNVKLSGNMIKHIPKQIKRLQNLVKLEINDNELEDVPELPSQIQSFSAVGNRIKQIEECETPNLDDLLLMRNCMTETPRFRGNKIQNLFITRNKINRILVDSLFQNIVKINATENQITEIPLALLELPSLELLNLARNKIQKIPAEIRNTRLVVLNVSENPITEIPEELPRTLACLYCSYCKLKILPESIGDLRYLETLVCCGNELTTWPLTSRILKKLLISRNKLTCLSDCLPESLLILDASCNNIVEVPEEFMIPALLELDLSHNKIEKLPDLSFCSRLTFFKVSDNPLDDVFDIRTFPFLDCLDMAFTRLVVEGLDGNRMREVVISDESRFTSSQFKLVTVNDTWLGYAELRGQRPSMEDSIVARPNISNGCDLYCVFDGHGGSWTATFSAYKIAELFRDAEFSEDFVQQRIAELVDALREENSSDGSTMVMSVLCRSEIIFAHLGDSRGIIIKEDGDVTFATKDHKPDNRDEIERILSIGGKITENRTDGMLATSRGLGDFSILGVSCDPVIQRIKIEEDDRWLVLGCDGLFDLLSNTEIGAISTTAESAQLLAYDLRNIAYHRLCRDNISAVVVDLKNRPV